jgi:hypothetical protein
LFQTIRGSNSAETFGTLSAMTLPTIPTRLGGPGRPTIARVAERAGVSVPTVSKVINGR